MGESAPRWIKKPPTENSEYRFYVGRASGEESESALIKMATKNAQEMAISENFGILTSISKESYQTIKSSSVVSRVSELSKNVILKKFRKKDQYIESNGKKKHIWLLFEYPKNEIKLETQRLETASASKAPLKFSEFNATQSVESGFLKVSTSPQGASITINGKNYGLSPSQIRLEQGNYSLFIDHPHFHHIKEEVFIQKDATSEVNKIMVRSRRKVHIQTKPEGAAIELSGKYLGISPIETTIPTGEKLNLLIQHPEAEIYQSSIEVGKGEDVHLFDIPLIFKPSYFSVESNPQGAEVYLNNKSMGKTPISLIQGKVGDKLKIIKKGYLDHTDTLRLKGGERRQLAITLMMESNFKNSINDSETARMAVESGNINIISLLIKNGANINEKYEDGETLLGLVMAELNEDNMDMVELLVKNGANINTRDTKGRPLFHQSLNTYGCNKDLTSFFIENGADVNINDFTNGDQNGKVDSTSALPNSGKSLLHKIAYRYDQQRNPKGSKSENCLEVVSLLVENGADINAKDKHGKKPIDYVLDKKERKKWLSVFLEHKMLTSCKKGEWSSCISLANMEEKNGNMEQATRFFSKACEGGVWSICSKLGFLEKEANNEIQATYFFAKSCEGGEASSCSEAGLIEESLGNIKKATYFFTKSCNGNEFSICSKLSFIQEGLGNYNQAVKLLEKACNGGEQNFCLEAGKMIQRKISSENKVRLGKLFEERTLKRGFFSLGFSYIGSTIGRVNYKKVTFNERDMTNLAHDKDLTFQDSFGISVGYTKFINKNFLKIGLDITTNSNGKDDNTFSLQPASLTTDFGRISRLGSQSCLKFFGVWGCPTWNMEQKRFNQISQLATSFS